MGVCCKYPVPISASTNGCTPHVEARRVSAGNDLGRSLADAQAFVWALNVSAPVPTTPNPTPLREFPVANVPSILGRWTTSRSDLIGWRGTSEEGPRAPGASRES